MKLALTPRQLLLGVWALTAAWLLGMGAVWPYANEQWAASVRGVGAEAAAFDSNGRLYRDLDPLYWIDYARTMATTDAWRVRSTHIDHASAGRPVHWSQSEAWCLALAGRLRAACSGESVHDAIDRASGWVGPVQQLIFLSVFGLLIYRRLGAGPAAWWMALMAVSPMVYWAFHPLRPDHHGLQLAFQFGGLMTLTLGGLGWVRNGAPAGVDRGAFFIPWTPPDARSARRWFIASGLLFGLAVWVGATVQVVGLGVLAGLTVLVLGASRLYGKPATEAAEYRPGLWRWWGGAGALAALVMYAVEYAPHAPGMRLETNHPVYALAFACLGWLLADMAAWRIRRAPRRVWARLFFAALGAGLPLALTLWGPASWHAYRDPLLWRYRRFTAELFPLWANGAGRCLYDFTLYFGATGWLLPVMAIRWSRSRASGFAREATALAVGYGGVFLALALLQARWLNTAAAALIWSLVIGMAFMRARDADGRAGRRGWLVVLLMAQIAVQGGAQLYDALAYARADNRSASIAMPAFTRRFVAEWASRQTLRPDFRLFCDPDIGGWIHHFGGPPCVGSLYWENLDGIRDVCAFFTAEREEEAHALARKHGITHVLIPSVNTLQTIYWIRYGREDFQRLRATLGGRLILRPPAEWPAWLQPDEEITALGSKTYFVGAEGLPVTTRFRVARIVDVVSTNPDTTGP